MAVTGAAIVVPARNEAELLPSCLDGLAAAVSAVHVPVHVVVALDRCDDDSAEIVRARPWVTAIELAAGNVGRARAAGADVALQLGSAHDRDRLWLASTDADSVVPAGWLATQLVLAADGWEVVVGTVEVDDWSERTDGTRSAWHAGYHATDHHPHVHGTNLGMTAEAYLAAGGYAALEVGEDVDLVSRLAGRRMIRTAAHPVLTSARREPRAVGGFGDHLTSLAG